MEEADLQAARGFQGLALSRLSMVLPATRYITDRQSDKKTVDLLPYFWQGLELASLGFPRHRIGHMVAFSQDQGVYRGVLFFFSVFFFSFSFTRLVCILELHGLESTLQYMAFGHAGIGIGLIPRGH